MDIELNQLASAMLVLVLAAVMLVTGLLFIERSDGRYDTGVNAANSVLWAAAGPLARDGFVRTSARSPKDRFERDAETFSGVPRTY
jgi:hypothetical protein